MKFYKVKAGSLQFAIMISAIIAVLLSVFMILIHSHSMFAKKSDILIETIQQTENTLIKSLVDFSVERDTILNVIDEEKNMTSKLHSGYWGMYGKMYAEMSMKAKRFEKIALVSGWQSVEKRTALYLKETNRPLVVVGNSKIEGKAYLPKQGVRAGTISGTSFYGNKLVYGSILKSKEELPKFPAKLKEQLIFLQGKSLPVNNESYIDLKPNKTYTNSFREPTKTIFSNSELDLFRVKLVGNIVIRSNTKIKVAASSVLKDVILIAPEIEIEDNTKGVFQAIANQQIIVGKNCELNYPSALVLLAEDDVELTSNLTKKKNIFIDEDTTIKGMVCYLQDNTTVRFEPQVLLKESTKIEGLVYCEQQLELLGSVYGSLYTSGFITKQSGSVYQNHMYNGVISSSELMDEYVGFPFENLNYKVVKWLY
ncbi:hypothetical protein [Kordia sp.]|uniref:hypothetical protein n=1 Tax=Kordia sp. TaxID=1965332 RepID=UPI003B5CA69F